MHRIRGQIDEEGSVLVPFDEVDGFIEEDIGAVSAPRIEVAVSESKRFVVFEFFKALSGR